MTLHWEATYGERRSREIEDEKDFKGHVDFVAQNMKTADFGDRCSSLRDREHQRRAIAIVGQAFPTPDRQPRARYPTGATASRTTTCRRSSTKPARRRRPGGRRAVAQRHGRRPEDGQPRPWRRRHPRRPTPTTAYRQPVIVKQRRRPTLVTNAGSNGKVPGRARPRRQGRQGRDFRYKLLPVFANLIPADPAMAASSTRCARPTMRPKLPRSSPSAKACCTRRGNFNGLGPAHPRCPARREERRDRFSPGFRWGTTLLPGDSIGWNTCSTRPPSPTVDHADR